MPTAGLSAEPPVTPPSVATVASSITGLGPAADARRTNTCVEPSLCSWAQATTAVASADTAIVGPPALGSVIGAVLNAPESRAKLVELRSRPAPSRVGAGTERK